MTNNVPNSHLPLEEIFDKCRNELGLLAASTVLRIIVEIHGGRRISIPTMKYVYRKMRNERIKAEFHGGNYKELAIRYGIGTTTVRRIIHNKKSR